MLHLLHGCPTLPLRLNGAVGPVFKDWLFKNFPDRANKVWNLICETHGGKASDSRLGVRMRGEGKFAESIIQIFRISKNRFINNTQSFSFNCNLFQQKKEVGGSLALWNISKKETATTASSKASRLGLIDENS